MSRHIWTRQIVAALIAAVSVQAVVVAQAPAQAGKRGNSGAGFWNPEVMMEIYVKALSRQYNLSPDQEEYTRKLLTKRVKEFLKDHETDLRTLMFDMMEFQQKKQLPPPEMAKQWAEMGKPIFTDARKAILDGNKEWREILNEDQRKRHDTDLNMLDRQFKIMEERLDKWGKGNIEQGDFQPAGAPQQRIGGNTPPWDRAKPEDTWELYLRWFSVRYALDDAQKETGRSVLRECRERATAYREKHKSDFDEIDAKVKELKETRSKDGGDDKDALAAAVKAMDQLQAKKVELERPISQDIFAEFKKRIEQIPTKEQRALVEQKEKAREKKATTTAEAKEVATTTAPTR